MTRAKEETFSPGAIRALGVAIAVAGVVIIRANLVAGTVILVLGLYLFITGIIRKYRQRHPRRNPNS